MKRSQAFSFGMAFGLLLPSCSGSPNQNTTPFGEHRPAAIVKAAALHLGEDCAVGGYRSCRSQICGHFAANPEAGYFCTKSCAREFDCPHDWACAQVFPSSDGLLCIPPSDWHARIAMLRSGAVK